MAIKFKVVEKCEPGVRGGGTKKYHACTVSSGVTELDELIEKIKERSNFDGADLVKMIYALEDTIAHELADGKIVRLELLGSFYPSVRGEGKDSAKEVSSKSIRKVKVNFRSGKYFRRTVADAGFKKVED
jgi:predicted histone-like DNA-binding protein